MKRSLISQSYDPLGWLPVPSTVNFKILMQDVCKMKVTWDQPLDRKHLSRWEGLIEERATATPLNGPMVYGQIPPINFNCLVSMMQLRLQLFENSDDQGTPSFVVSKKLVSQFKPFPVRSSCLHSS